jgi:hypothetical protein
MVDPYTSPTIGVIFPLFEKHIVRFFIDHKTVFVKFTTHESVGERLDQCSRLFFYSSRGEKEIVGEARILKKFFSTPDEVLTNYSDVLFLTHAELQEYVGKRKTKRMLVLVLDKPTKYANPLKMPQHLTMAGQYMTQNLYDELVGKTKR